MLSANIGRQADEAAPGDGRAPVLHREVIRLSQGVAPAAGGGGSIGHSRTDGARVRDPQQGREQKAGRGLPSHVGSQTAVLRLTEPRAGACAGRPKASFQLAFATATGANCIS
ncbi:MAG: hypothetical protein WB421_06895 [Terriglobales bacterium]